MSINNRELPPYIADQRWSHLRPAPGLSEPAQAQAIWEGLRQLEERTAPPEVDRGKKRYTWEQVTDRKRQILQQLVHDPAYQHLVFVDAAGMGKTTTSKAIVYALTYAEFGVFPCLIEAQWFVEHATRRNVGPILLDTLVEMISAQLPESKAGPELIRRDLQRHRDQGRLVIAVDALDQATGSLEALRRLLDEDETNWGRVKWVITGRPYSLEVHRELFQKQQFQFFRLEPFTDEQKTLYLKRVDEPKSRYLDERLTDEIKQVIGVPRMLKILRYMERDEFERLATATDLLWHGLDQMLREGLRLNPGAGLSPQGNSETNREFAWRLLATVAFLVTSSRTKTRIPKSKDSTLQPNFHGITQGEFDTFPDALWERMEPVLQKKGIAAKATADQLLQKLALLGEALRSDLLVPGQERGPADAVRVKFVNKTWQEFLCAVYLAKYAAEADRELIWKQNWIVEWDRPETQAYEEIWRYFCDLRAEHVDDYVWLETVALLYRPGWRQENGTWTARRSPECLYRTWWRLNKLALEPWSPQTTLPGRISERQAELAERARQIRNRWWGEFEQIRGGQQGLERHQLAVAFAGDFLAFDGGNFWFGNSDFGNESLQDESLQEREVLPFALGRRPITNEWLRLFAPQHGLRGPEKDIYAETSGEVDCPAIFVDFYLAWAYGLWSRWEKGSSRLPFEEEFEFVGKLGMSAEQQQTWWYWWDEEQFALRYYNVNDEVGRTTAASRAHAIPATQSEAEPGIMDLLGNVREWQADAYRAKYDRNDRDWTTPMYTFRSVRGGSWNDYPGYVRLAGRNGREPTNRDHFTGFRLARTP